MADPGFYKGGTKEGTNLLCVKIKKIGLAVWLKFAFVDLPLVATPTLLGKMKDKVESLSQHVQEMKYNLFKFQREKKTYICSFSYCAVVEILIVNNHNPTESFVFLYWVLRSRGHLWRIKISSVKRKYLL